MVGLFLKQVSPELLLLEPWALFSQTLCIKNCPLAHNGANGSMAACSSPLLGLLTYFSIFRMRWKPSLTLTALSQLQFLQLFLSTAPTSGAQTVPPWQYPSPMTNNLCLCSPCLFSSWDLEPCMGEGDGYRQKIALGEAWADLLARSLSRT